MSLRKYANRRDENEKEIVNALEQVGCTVYRLDQPVDLAVGRNGITMFIEVKNPDKPKKDRQLTKAQREFFADWKGQVCKVETAAEAIEVVQRLTRRDHDQTKLPT